MGVGLLHLYTILPIRLVWVIILLKRSRLSPLRLMHNFKNKKKPLEVLKITLANSAR